MSGVCGLCDAPCFCGDGICEACWEWLGSPDHPDNQPVPVEPAGG